MLLFIKLKLMTFVAESPGICQSYCHVIVGYYSLSETLSCCLKASGTTWTSLDGGGGGWQQGDGWRWGKGGTCVCVFFFLNVSNRTEVRVCPGQTASCMRVCFPVEEPHWFHKHRQGIHSSQKTETPLTTYAEHTLRKHTLTHISSSRHLSGFCAKPSLILVN